MALAHSTTFNFYNAERPYDGSSYTVYNSFHLYHVKEAFKAAGWTVIGSYNGDTAGTVSNDGTTTPLVAGTDNWTSETIVYNDSGRRWWIVMQCPAAMGKVQICIAANYTGTSNQNYWNLWSSHTGGFLAANGGTDGTNVNPPTASDQYQHIAVFRPVSNDPDRVIGVYCAYSTDGKQIFLFGREGSSNTLFMSACVLDSAAAALDDSVVYFFECSNAIQSDDPTNTKMDNGDHYTSAQWIGRVSGTLRAFYLGGRGWNNVGIQSQVTIGTDKKAIIGPCELYASTVGVRGYYGTIPDMYWVSNNYFNQGFGDSVGGPINWYCGGSLLVPWDSTEPLPRIR
jgi:hypothetical protein